MEIFKKPRLIILSICLAIFSNLTAQNVLILKDSLIFNEATVVLQEVKFPYLSKNEKIYKQIHEIWNSNDYLNYNTPEQRLYAKKRDLAKLIDSGIVMDAAFPIESYEINYNKKDIIGLSIKLNVIGSPFEGMQYLTIDLKVKKIIKSDLFKNNQELVKIIKKRIQQEEGDLSKLIVDTKNFQLVTNAKGCLQSVVFHIYDNRKEGYRANSYFPEYSISIEKNTIYKYISSTYKSRL